MMNNGTAATTWDSSWGTGNWVTYNITTDVSPNDSTIGMSISKPSGKIHPNLYFKYIKSKFTMFQRHKIEKRLEELERAFYSAVEAGQDALADKFLSSLNVEAKQTAMLARGINSYIDRDVLMKYKNQIRGGHISNTMLKDFTRVIPDKVLEKKKKVEGIFDDYEIWHYWNPDAKDVGKMKEEERAKMKDPVMFGLIKGSNRMYFIAEWEDEYCDLSFDEIVKVVGKSNKHKINKKPELELTKNA